MKKTWKRNLIAAGVLLVVCAGIYLNWYAGHSAADLTETLDAGKILDDTTLVLQQEQGDALVTPVQQTGTQAEYFAQMRLSARRRGTRPSSCCRRPLPMPTEMPPAAPSSRASSRTRWPNPRSRASSWPRAIRTAWPISVRTASPSPSPRRRTPDAVGRPPAVGYRALADELQAFGHPCHRR